MMKMILRSSAPTKRGAPLTATVIRVGSHLPLDHRLVGQTLTVSPSEVHLTLRRGTLFEVLLTEAQMEDLYACWRQELPLSSVSLSVMVSPLREPAVRVPLSLLRSLRGQTEAHEQSRLALVESYQKDDTSDEH